MLKVHKFKDNTVQWFDSNRTSEQLTFVQTPQVNNINYIQYQYLTSHYINI